MIALITLTVSIVCLLVTLYLVWKIAKSDVLSIQERLHSIQNNNEHLERTVRDEIGKSREEFSRAGRDQREELTLLFRAMSDQLGQRFTDLNTAQRQYLHGFADQLKTFAVSNEEQMAAAKLESAAAFKNLREEVAAGLKAISETITKHIGEWTANQQVHFNTFAEQLKTFTQESGERLDKSRAEATLSGKQLREEVATSLKNVSETTIGTLKELAAAEKSQLDGLSANIAALTKQSTDKLDSLRQEQALASKQLREEVQTALRGIAETTTTTMTQLTNVQKGQLDGMASGLDKLVESIGQRFEALRLTIEGKLTSLQEQNSKQLDQMRLTVDEKLQGTLEKRLGESFRQVSERLEQVHKGLGEMQTLASGVGDLKKVLTNVKTRGTWGEVQLAALLAQVLNPDQYSENVPTKGAGERVEFAIKLPGQGTDTVWLPIDAKFPLEDYQRLVDAQEAGDLTSAEAAGRDLEARVKNCAKDISNKYLNPPMTTDFAILFLPVEGLFAEVVRRSGLAEFVQRECRVVLAGPTTLWSILNSLQMGFRTLAIQKRSSEVWNLLAAVKTEWAKYGEVLDSVQKKLHEASNTIDKAQVRSRAVGRKLRDVQQLPVEQATALLSVQPISDEDIATTEERGDESP